VSKPVRIYDATYAEIEELARADRRSVANMVQLVLERGLEALRDGRDSGAAVGEWAVSGSAIGGRKVPPGEPERAAPEHFRPDPKPGRK
jgi:hypothetical protein